MKRLTLVDVSTLSDNFQYMLEAVDQTYYAVVTDSLNGVGFIMSNSFRRGPFHVIAASACTHHNTFGSEKNTLRQMVEYLLGMNWIVLQFDNQAEFFTWLGKATSALDEDNPHTVQLPLSMLSTTDIEATVVYNRDERKITPDL